MKNCWSTIETTLELVLPLQLPCWMLLLQLSLLQLMRRLPLLSNTALLVLRFEG